MCDKTNILKIVQLEAQLKMYEPIIASLQTLPVLQENIREVKDQINKINKQTDDQDDTLNSLNRTLDILTFKLDDTIKNIEKDRDKIEEYLKLVDSVKSLGWKILYKVFPTFIVFAGMIFGAWELLKEKF